MVQRDSALSRARASQPTPVRARKLLTVPLRRPLHCLPLLWAAPALSFAWAFSRRSSPAQGDTSVPCSVAGISVLLQGDAARAAP